ncbi:MAG: HNH endonuclease [Prevotella sp.]|nr:HNH endonuclease [Prevotella sp.]
MISPFFPERDPHFFGKDVKSLFGESSSTSKEVLVTEKLDSKIKIEYEKSAFLPKNGGEWTGKPGDSDWKPNKDIEPGDRHGTNPEQKTWAEIMKEYGFESIPFKDGEPDFSEIAKAKVEINDFSDDRDSNFDQADEKAAEQKGCTPEEVAEWREKHKYTWHECRDCRTMQKVPTEVHGNIPHSGGISEYKSHNGDV